MDLDYPLAHTKATKMLAKAFESIREQKGLSQRKVAQMLGYGSSVVLSHMALGRVKIPIDRVPVLSDTLGMNKKRFMEAVLEQRYPNTDIAGILSEGTSG